MASSYVPKRACRALLLAALALVALPSVPAWARLDVATRPVRLLYLTQRFTPSQAPPTVPQAARLVALRGETEGFQVAVRAPGGRLVARLGVGADAFLAGRTRVLGVGFVRVRRTSAGAGHGPGLYADPLPPPSAGGIATTRGRWAGFAILVDVPFDAPPGEHAGTIELSTAAGAPVASVAFSVRVSRVAALRDGDARALKVVGGISRGWYTRAAPVGGAGRTRLARLAAQRRSLLGFLSAHHLAPVEWQDGLPSRAGTYRPGGAEAAGEARRFPWRASFLPNRGGSFTMRRGWSRGGARFVRNVAAYWRSRGWIDGRTYFYAWDEPGRRTERLALPAINRLVHRLAPGVKTFATAFPHLPEPGRRICAYRCVSTAPRGSSNRRLWDGGPDDVDAWAVATNRYYGRWTSPVERAAGIDHTRQTWRLLQRVRSRGKEIWSYSYYMPTRRLPQLVIDGAPTDPRLLMVWNGFERNTGWLLWQLARWIPARASNYERSRPRNPYTDTISSVTPNGEVANGDVSLFYPPVSRRYGLADPTAPPVTSLRLESLRDGIEDADLIALARERAGARAVRRALAPVLGPVRKPEGLGWTWRAYRNAGLAGRLEAARRRLIAKLEVDN